VEGWNEGTVSAYSIDPATGRLTYINKQPTRGSTTCQNSRDRKGNFLLAANYSSSPENELPNKAIIVLPIRDDGGLEAGVADAVHIGSGPNPDRQERPHPHAVQATPDNRYLVVADLGLDLLITYRFDPATGTIARHGAAALPPGSGPPDTGDLRADAAAWFREVAAHYGRPPQTSLLRALTSAAAESEEVSSKLLARFVVPFRSALVARLSEAQRAGHVRADAPLALVAEALMSQKTAQIRARMPSQMRSAESLSVWSAGMSPARMIPALSETALPAFAAVSPQVMPR
jgi:hypothetical protein